MRMNNILNVKAGVCGMVGLVGGFVSRLFGGWSSDMTTLIIFMAIDFLMGLIVAGVFGNSDKSETGSLDSKAGWKGLSKKCITLAFVLVAYRLDVSLGTNYIKSGTIIAFIVNETISIVENAGLMGIPLPQAITKGIELLKDKNNQQKKGK